MRFAKPIFLVLFALLLAAANVGAQDWQTVYETDFSTDPGWITNSPSDLYWDPVDGVYHVNEININYGGNYGCYDADYDGGSFLLEWDIMITHREYASGLVFGIFDGDYNTNNSESYAMIVLVGNDQGNVTGLEWCGLPPANTRSVYENAFQWSLDTWYRVRMEYNSTTLALSADVSLRETGQLLFSLSATGVGPFDSDMTFIGNSNVRDGTYQRPGAQFVGSLDNVLYALQIPDGGGECPPLYTFTGETLNDLFGMSVSGAGDVNNDGFDDLIIGAPGNDAAGLFAGRAYIYSGADESLLYMFTGATDHDFFGTAVSGAGDVNGDGFDDLLIGASQAWGTSSWGSGVAYIYSGADGSLLFTFTGEAEDDRFGMYHISGAGDVNNDGFADVIVGASYNDALGHRTGKAYVFHGSGGPLPITTHASNADMIFTGTVTDGGLGFSVAGAGDVNSDDHDDLIVGAWNSSGVATVHVYSGFNGSILYNLIAETSGDAFGYSVSAGDLNNDGLVDFVVGTPRNHTAGQYAGRAYVFYGRSETFPITISASDADIAFIGEYPGEYFGIDVSIVRDVNHDNCGDIVIGAYGYDDPYNWSGRAYVYSGSDGTLLHTLRSEGVSQYDNFGLSVSAAGDVNNDGSPDIIIGARQENNSGNGKAYVYSCWDMPGSLPIALDIKPGSCPNPLNIKGYAVGGEKPPDDGDGQSTGTSDRPDRDRPRAVLPVAILGSESFDVTTIDMSTIELEGVSPVRWSYEDVSQPLGDQELECECNSEGADGFDDLTLKFDKQAIISALGEVAHGDLVSLAISAELLDGTALQGSDCVVIIDGKRRVDDGVAEDPDEDVATVQLIGNNPNPFNPVTNISFSLPTGSFVKLDIMNVLGQTVTTIVDGYVEAGDHTVSWDGRSSASGIYFYRLTAGDFVETKKMLLLK